MGEKFFGEFWEYSVVVIDRDAIAKLVKFGNFGKGTLSRSTPKFLQCSEDENIRIESNPNADKRIAHKKRLIVASNPAQKYSEKELQQKIAEFNSSSDPLELFQLSLVEAFFLSFILKCLIIKYQNKELSIDDQWNLFQKVQPNFVAQYIAYSYYRKHGWIPKSGLKFGVDYVLYETNPDHCHANYAVIIRPPYPEQKMPPFQNCDCCLSWLLLSTLNRVSESVSKELIIAYIVDSDNIHNAKTQTNVNTEFNVNRTNEENKTNNRLITSLRDVQNYTVKEFILSRWRPSKTRE